VRKACGASFKRPVSPFVCTAMDVVIGENVDWKSNPGDDPEWQRKVARVDRLPGNKNLEKERRDY
jgi:hypothetical protein